MTTQAEVRRAFLNASEQVPNQTCKCMVGPEWSGSLHPEFPDEAWVCDDCERVILCEPLAQRVTL